MKTESASSNTTSESRISSTAGFGSRSVTVGCITPEMPVSVDAHERFTLSLSSTALRNS